MPILRAGPWGNLTDSFQNVPAATNVELDHYPVNIAKGNWPTQNWAAWYEVTSSACCTPDTITVEWEYYAVGESTLKSYTEQLTRREGTCDYYRETAISCSYYGNTVEYLLVSWSGSAWDMGGGTDCFASEVYADTSGNTDECDPTGTYDLYGLGGFATGYYMTITTP